jgi:transcription-repair coupling factor (superfamily II helicase)
MGRPAPRAADASVELNEDAYIPDSYIQDEALKLDMYRKVAESVTIKKARAVREEFIDRFGPLPKEVENLLGASVIRGYASRAGFVSVIRLRDTVNLRFAEDAVLDVSSLEELIKTEKGWAQLRYATPPFISYRLKKGGSYTEMLQFMGKIRHCISNANQV